MILFGVGIDLFDLDRSIVFDLKTFSAIIAYLIGVKIADLAFHAVIAVFRLIQNAFDSFHFLPLPSIIAQKERDDNFFCKNILFLRTFVCNFS